MDKKIPLADFREQLRLRAKPIDSVNTLQTGEENLPAEMAEMKRELQEKKLLEYQIKIKKGDVNAFLLRKYGDGNFNEARYDGYDNTKNRFTNGITYEYHVYFDRIQNAAGVDKYQGKRPAQSYLLTAPITSPDGDRYIYHIPVHYTDDSKTEVATDIDGELVNPNSLSESEDGLVYALQTYSKNSASGTNAFSNSVFNSLRKHGFLEGNRFNGAIKGRLVERYLLSINEKNRHNALVYLNEVFKKEVEEEEEAAEEEEEDPKQEAAEDEFQDAVPVLDEPVDLPVPVSKEAAPKPAAAASKPADPKPAAADPKPAAPKPAPPVESETLVEPEKKATVQDKPVKPSKPKSDTSVMNVTQLNRALNSIRGPFADKVRALGDFPGVKNGFEKLLENRNKGDMEKYLRHMKDYTDEITTDGFDPDTVTETLEGIYEEAVEVREKNLAEFKEKKQQVEDLVEELVAENSFSEESAAKMLKASNVSWESPKFFSYVSGMKDRFRAIAEKAIDDFRGNDLSVLGENLSAKIDKEFEETSAVYLEIVKYNKLFNGWEEVREGWDALYKKDPDTKGGEARKNAKAVVDSALTAFKEFDVKALKRLFDGKGSQIKLDGNKSSLSTQEVKSEARIAAAEAKKKEEEEAAAAKAAEEKAAEEARERERKKQQDKRDKEETERVRKETEAKNAAKTAKKDVKETPVVDEDEDEGIITRSKSRKSKPVEAEEEEEAPAPPVITKKTVQATKPTQTGKKKKR